MGWNVGKFIDLHTGIEFHYDGADVGGPDPSFMLWYFNMADLQAWVEALIDGPQKWLLVKDYLDKHSKRFTTHPDRYSVENVQKWIDANYDLVYGPLH